MIEPSVIHDSRTDEVKFWVGEEAQAYVEWRVEVAAHQAREEDFDLRSGPSPGREPVMPKATGTVSRSEALLLAAKLLVGPMGYPGPTGPQGSPGPPA